MSLGTDLTALADRVAAQLDMDAATIAAQADNYASLATRNADLAKQVIDLKAQVLALTPPMPLVAGLSVEGMSSPVPQVTNFICNARWEDMQREPFGPLTPDNAIDLALATGKSFRVRLYFGQHSPAFAYTMAGKVRVTDAQDGVTTDVPVWWNADLQQAQADFVGKLAAAYDGKVSAIFMASNGTVYAEPFIRQTGDSATRAALLAAGYTQADDEASYGACLAMFSAFKVTRVGWAFNPHQYVTASGTGGINPAFTTAQIAAMRERFPSAIAQNNSVRVPTLGGQYPSMYMALRGSPPLSFQLATEARVGNYAQAIQWCISQGAHLVELSPGFQKYLTAQQLVDFDKALRANG